MRLDLARMMTAIPSDWSVDIRSKNYVIGVSPDRRNYCHMWINGKQRWLRDGIYHREDGPAWVQPYGHGSFWYRNGLRVNSPGSNHAD